MKARLRMLGLAAVERDESRIDIPDTAPAYLAIYLAVQADWVPREVIGAYLWPSQPAERAQHNLRVALNRLGTLLQRWGLANELSAERRRIRLQVDSDFAFLREAVQKRAWRDGLAWAAGPFLPTMTFVSYPVLQEWAAVERESVRRLWRDSLLGAARVGPVPEELLVRYLRHYADDIEVVQIRVAQASVQNESAAATAIAVFEEADRHQGGQPEEALSSLHSIRTAVAGAVTALPGGRVVGRDEDIERLDRLLRAHRLVTVTGLPGVGKSSIVEAWSQRPSDVAVVLLSVGEASTPESVASRLLRALHILDARVGLDNVVAQLADARFVLALDGLDQAAGAGARLAPLLLALLEGCPGSRIVIASRQPTALAGESVMPVGGLRIEPHDDESRSPSEQLFREMAHAARPAVDLSNTAATRRVLELTGGHPLAVRLAASWLRFLSLEEIALQLQGLGGRGAIDTKLESVIEESIRRLDGQDRKIGEQLAVFASDFLVVSAATVSECGVGDIARLIQSGLVLEDSASAGRLRLHPLVRTRLAAGLRRSARWRDTVRRFIEDVDRRVGEPRRADGRQIFSAAQIDPVFEDVLHAWALALEIVESGAARNLAALVLVWTEMRGAFDLGAAALGRASEVFDEDQPTHCAALAMSEVGRATLLYRSGDYDDAEAVAKRAASLSKRSNQGALYRQALNVLGLSLWMQVRLEEARASFNEALQSAVDAGERWGQRVTGGNLALIEKALGHWNDAETSMRAVLLLNREVGAWSSVATHSTNLANLLTHLRRFEEAQNFYEEGVRLAREHRLDVCLPFAFIGLAQLNLARGDWVRAREYVKLTRTCPLEAPVAADAFIVEARIYIEAGDLAAAAACILEALQITVRAGARAKQLEALMAYALWMRRVDNETAGARLLSQVAASPLAHAALRENIERLVPTPPATEDEALDLTLATETALARLRRGGDPG